MCASCAQADLLLGGVSLALAHAASQERRGGDRSAARRGQRFFIPKKRAGASPSGGKRSPALAAVEVFMGAEAIHPHAL